MPDETTADQTREEKTLFSEFSEEDKATCLYLKERGSIFQVE